MVELQKDTLIIKVENVSANEYLRMLDTLVWVFGRFSEEQEIYVNLHSLAWLIAAMLPDENQLMLSKKPLSV